MERWGWCLVLCVFMSPCACNFPPPHRQFPPPSSPNSAMLLPSVSTHPSPLPPPLPLFSSPFHLDEKILILRLFFLFSFFCNTTVVRWPFLHATRMQPSDRRAKSAHLHTHLPMVLHTHSHTDAGDQRLGFVWFHPPLWLSPPLPPPWLLSAHLHTGNAVPLSTSSPHTALFFLFTIILSRKLWCVAVHRISMLESLWGRGPHEKGIGMGVDDINDFFCVCQISTR